MKVLATLSPAAHLQQPATAKIAMFTYANFLSDDSEQPSPCAPLIASTVCAKLGVKLQIWSLVPHAPAWRQRQIQKNRNRNK